MSGNAVEMTRVLRNLLAEASTVTGDVEGKPGSFTVWDQNGRAYVVSVRTEADHNSDQEDLLFLTALQEAGVDNWEGYGYARWLLRGEGEW